MALWRFLNGMLTSSDGQWLTLDQAWRRQAFDLNVRNAVKQVLLPYDKRIEVKHEKQIKEVNAIVKKSKKKAKK